MSTRRRMQHHEKGMAQQLAKCLRRTLQALKDMRRGSYSPGPWKLAANPTYQPHRSHRRRDADLVELELDFGYAPGWIEELSRPEEVPE